LILNNEGGIKMLDYKIVSSEPDPAKIMTVRQFYESTPFGLEKMKFLRR
jgi:hypothetical protein